MFTTEGDVWEYAVTYGGPSLFLTAVFVFLMPVAWWKLVRPRVRRWVPRLAVMLTIWAVAWLIAYGDVWMAARAARELCETESGLKVYRTAIVDGFAGTSDIEKWGARGFAYVELAIPGGEILRYTFADGAKIRRRVATMKSRFEYAAVHSELPWGILRRAEQVREIATRRVLGERIMFRLPSGTWDRKLLGGLGFRGTPVWCVAPHVLTSETWKYPAAEIIERTLIAVGKTVASRRAGPRAFGA